MLDFVSIRLEVTMFSRSLSAGVSAFYVNKDTNDAQFWLTIDTNFTLYNTLTYKTNRPCSAKEKQVPLVTFRLF